MPSKKNDNKIHLLLEKYNFSKDLIYYYDESFIDETREHPASFSAAYYFLLWWPKIIPDHLIKIPSFGVINLHPSYLPYCRGKDPNFWSIVDEVEFGVSIHKVTPGIDDGPIIFQKKIKKSWVDNGQTLYNKAKMEIVKLFSESYPLIRFNKFDLHYQNLEDGSFHLRKELKPKSKININKI